MLIGEEPEVRPPLVPAIMMPTPEAIVRTPQQRRRYILKQDVARYGPTPECEACVALAAGAQRVTKPHSDECRALMDELMQRDEGALVRQRLHTDRLRWKNACRVARLNAPHLISSLSIVTPSFCHPFLCQLLPLSHLSLSPFVTLCHPLSLFVTLRHPFSPFYFFRFFTLFSNFFRSFTSFLLFLSHFQTFRPSIFQLPPLFQLFFFYFFDQFFNFFILEIFNPFSKCFLPFFVFNVFSIFQFFRGKEMLNACCVHASYDEYIAMVQTGNECQLSAYTLFVGKLFTAACCAEVLFQPSFLVPLNAFAWCVACGTEHEAHHGT